MKSIYSVLKDNKSVKEAIKGKHKAMKSQDIRKVLTQTVLPLVILSTFCCFCVRLSTNFHTLREEQMTSDPSAADQGSTTGQDSIAENRNVRFFLQAGCLLCSVYLPRKWLAASGNLNGATGTVLSCRFGLPAATVLTALYWALQCLPAKVLDSMAVWKQVILAQLVYVCVAVAGLSFLVWPLLVYMLPKKGKQISVSSNGAGQDLVSKLYEYMKQDLEEQTSGASDDGGQKEIPHVFGLGTVFTGALIYNGTTLLVLLSLLLSGPLSPSVLTAVLAIFSFLELFTVAVKICRDSDLLLPGIVTWSLLASNYFYGFGHQATIPAIRFEAAFVGFHGNWENKILPAAMITCNMFAAELLFIYLTPLLIVYPCTKGLLSGYILPRREVADGAWQGDYVMHNNPTTFRQLLVKTATIVFLIHGCKLGSSMLAAGIHRRHLMVWKIFAPRFVYQALSSFTAFAAMLLGMSTLFRVEKALVKWTEKLK